MSDNPWWDPIQEWAMEEGSSLVHHFWQDQIFNERWCYIFTNKPDQIKEEYWETFQEQMHRWSIKPTEGPDVLRWGYLEKGMFNIKEVYNIRIGNHAN